MNYREVRQRADYGERIKCGQSRLEKTSGDNNQTADRYVKRRRPRPIVALCCVTAAYILCLPQFVVEGLECVNSTLA